MSNFGFDPVQAQLDLADLLASDERLATVQVRSYRKMRLKEELDYRTLLTTPRAGRAGAGIIVAQPVGSGRNPGVTGPVLDWTFPIVCLELDMVNMRRAHGTLIQAEQLAVIVMDSLQLHADDLYGTFQIESNAIKPDNEFSFPGTIGYRVNFRIVGKGIQRRRVARVTWSVADDGSHVALACATPGARIRYTLDGTFPADDGAGNPASRAYFAPIPIAAGMVLRAAAWASGMNNSAVLYAEPVATGGAAIVGEGGEAIVGEGGEAIVGE